MKKLQTGRQHSTGLLADFDTVQILLKRLEERLSVQMKVEFVNIKMGAKMTLQ